MADQIVVMQGGVIEQVGSPLELYENPTNLFVAGFIGSPKMNFFNGEVAAGFGAQTIGVRPEHFTLSKSEGDWKGTAGITEHLGSDTYVQIDLGKKGMALARAIGNFDINFGDELFVTPTPDQIYRFDKEGLAM